MSEKYTPCVIVPGIGQSKVDLIDKEGNRIKSAWPIDLDADELINELKKPFIKSAILRRDAGLCKKAKSAVDKVIDPIAANPDGTSKNRLRVHEYPKCLKECSPEDKKHILRMVPMQKLCSIIGEENLYFFAYNSFGDPYETAERLNEFIQQIKKEKECEKVNLIPVSLGGVVSVAYFDMFGCQNDIKRVMYFVAALQGTYFISDLMETNIKKENAAPFIQFMTNRKTAESIMKVTRFLPKKVRIKILYSAFNALAETALLNCPMMWGAVPPEKYSELKSKFINNPVLEKKADRFYNAQKNFPQNVLKYKENGTEFFAAVGYGLQLIPIIASDKINSDTIIPVKSASLGAGCAPLGEKLSAEKSEYISPDSTVDASKSILPDTVWYFKNQPHDDIAYNDTALEIAANVLAYDDFNSVYSNPQYPRFCNQSDNRK